VIATTKCVSQVTVTTGIAIAQVTELFALEVNAGDGVSLSILFRSIFMPVFLARIVLALGTTGALGTTECISQIFVPGLIAVPQITAFFFLGNFGFVGGGKLICKPCNM